MSEKLNADRGRRPLKVLWIAQSCSLQDEEGNPGLTGRMESVLLPFFGERVRLAVAYMADGKHEQKMTRNGIEYYAVDADLRLGITDQDWERSRDELLRVIRYFEPDLIQCFGSEWPYGMIAEAVDIPVVVHLMGFLNIYYLSIQMARGETRQKFNPVKSLKSSLRKLIRRRKPKESVNERCKRHERRVMTACHFFFGRTQWDKNIARYYSPGSRYFHVPEVIKPSIYQASGQWEYHDRSRLRLFSLSSGDDRKGNEIILRTAEILRDLLGIDFEWRVAGSKDYFPRFEERTGIRHEEVGIELVGTIGSEDIIEEMRSADFFIHPSIMDNSPHSVCEAQLIGCPVIASNVGGLPEIVENGKTGFLYPYNEPHTLAFMIANLRGERELLTGISENEVREVRKRHDPEEIARLMLEAYETIVEEAEQGR